MAIKIPKIIYRYFMIALAVNIYLANGRTITEKIENAVVEPLYEVLKHVVKDPKEFIKGYYENMEKTGALSILKIALLSKLVAMYFRRRVTKRISTSTATVAKTETKKVK